MINKPTLKLNTSVIHKNIKHLVELCEQWQMDFRPHFKTHQSSAVAEMFRAQGVEKCCVSSVGMAQYFAQHQWKDITLAIPFNILEISEVNELAKCIHLSLIIDHIESVRFLIQHLQAPVDLYLEIDTAYGRSGIFYKNTPAIVEILDLIKNSKNIRFVGFLSHSGNTYNSATKEEVATVFEASRLAMLQVKNHFSEDYPTLKISMGDTPATYGAKNFEDITEWRPGNFVFNDLMQLKSGVCKIEDIALRIVCPIIGIYKERGEFVIYGGAVHLSKEKLILQGKEIFGQVIAHNAKPVSGSIYVQVLSQEHGIIAASSTFLQEVKIGDLVEIIPVHSCLTANLHSYYRTEEDQVFPKWTGGL